jgi:serine/threonine protein kinase
LALEERDHRNTLPKGFWLNEYQIESVLGKPGGFGITYLATDTHLRQMVAIKEYLPTDFAVREGRSTVCVRSASDEESFRWGLKCFIEEARVLARFSHPNIVRVLRYFEENSTAYMVMEYQKGKCLTEHLNNHGTLSEEELLAIIMPLLDGLEEIHRAEILHRDIKPNNIYIRNNNHPVLLDFGSARYAVGQKSRSVTSIVTPGYAPLEQYDNEISDQGPWTDIYALGAVMYRAIQGEPPPAATRRVMKDPMIPAVEVGKGRYGENLLKAVDWALQLSEEDRPQSVEEWRKAFSDRVIPPGGHLLPSSNTKKAFLPTGTHKSQWLLMAVTGVAVISMLVILLTLPYYQNNAQKTELRHLRAEVAEKRTALKTLQGQLDKTEKELSGERERRKYAELLLEKIKRFEDIQAADTPLAAEAKVSKYYDVVSVSANDSLNIRSFPGHLSSKTGAIPPNGRCIVYLGKFRIIGTNVWVQIQYREMRGWVNTKYLIENEHCDKKAE